MTGPFHAYLQLFPVAYMLIWAVGVASMIVAYRNATKR